MACQVYAADPVTAWVSRFNGPDYTAGLAGVVKTDGAGNVYVTGYLGFDIYTGLGGRYATVKYDPDGNELWAVDFSPGANSQPVSMLVDDLGNVYVAGHSAQEYDFSDYVIVKYDTDGTQLWVALYQGPLFADDRVAAMALDALGNVYVTGRTSRGFMMTGTYATTVKYDIEGN
jgi:streptogramin lyase